MIAWLLIVVFVLFCVWAAAQPIAPVLGRVPPTPQQRAAAFARNQLSPGLYQCTYCRGVGPRSHGPDGKPWNIDHIVPVYFGGTTVDSNLTLACQTCNLAKGVTLWPVPSVAAKPDADLAWAYDLMRHPEKIK